MSNLNQHLQTLREVILNANSGNSFIDGELIKQFFHVSDRTLARRREDSSLKAYTFGKKKFFYHIDNVMELFTPRMVLQKENKY